MARRNTLKPGDRVAYSAAFLRNTGQAIGNAPRRRGTVESRRNESHVYVRWDDTTPEELREVWGDDPEYIAKVLEKGTMVAECHLAKAPGSRSGGKVVQPNLDFCEPSYRPNWGPGE